MYVLDSEVARGKYDIVKTWTTCHSNFVQLKSTVAASNKGGGHLVFVVITIVIVVITIVVVLF